MFLPDNAVAPPFTDSDLDDLFAFEESESVGIDPELSQEDAAEQGVIPVAYGWQITSTSGAEWAMQKYARTIARIGDIDATADELRGQIDAWQKRERTPLDKRANHFLGLLSDWLRKARDDPEDGRKSIALPSGDIESRWVRPKAEVVKKRAGEDEEEFVAWAKVYLPGVVKPKWSPVMDAVKKAIDFRTVLMPNEGPIHEMLFDVGDSLVALPPLPPDYDEITLESLDPETLLAESHHEETMAVWHEENGSWWLVPGVVQVPGEVRYSVTPNKQGKP
jgi:hypothetical protein